VAQQYLPDSLQGARFYRPNELGFEGVVKERVEKLRELQEKGLARERLLEEVSTGRERRRRAQLEEHGVAQIRLRDRVLERAGISLDSRILDLGERPGLLAWGALERAPLGKVAALAGEMEAARIRKAAEAEEVDRILESISGDLAAIPVDVETYHCALGIGALHARADRPAALLEILRVLKRGGSLNLYEPLLAEGRRISEDVDLRPLGADLARRIREVEDEIYGDPEDPRMALSGEGLAEELGAAGFTGISCERTIEARERKMTSDQVVRLFSGKRQGSRASYEEWLLGKLSPDELAVYRRLAERELLGRTLHRPVIGLLCTARKP
jgi:ubiquinone/menaquinone biosynthesis C-methylase UbiE